MRAHTEGPIPSKVTVMHHPLHPMVVVFPISFLMFTLVTDAAYWYLRDAFWAQASFWLVAAGFVLGVVAALLGLADFVLLKEARREITGWSHMVLGIMTLSLAGANVQLRWDDPVAAALPWGLFLSMVMALTVSLTGWLGGTLTFRHGIGTYGPTDAPDGRDAAPGPAADTAAHAGGGAADTPDTGRAAQVREADLPRSRR